MLHHTVSDPLAPSRDAERGASLVEYALLLALIAIVAFAAVNFLGDSTADSLSSVGSRVQHGS